MNVFADSSAVVKRYVDEPHSESVRALAGPINVAAIALVEVSSALWRRGREAAKLEQVAALVRRFEDEVRGRPGAPPVFIPMALGWEILREAASLVRVHPLRAFDAIQLASAMAARSADKSVDSILVFDERLRVAAAIEGFIVTPATVDSVAS